MKLEWLPKYALQFAVVQVDEGTNAISFLQDLLANQEGDYTEEHQKLSKWIRFLLKNFRKMLWVNVTENRTSKVLCFFSTGSSKVEMSSIFDVKQTETQFFWANQK